MANVAYPLVTTRRGDNDSSAMTCNYCQSANAADDHRCRRCGRRLMGSAVEAPPEYAERALQAVGAERLAAATSEMVRPGRQRSSRLDGQPALFLDDPPPSNLPDTAELYPPRKPKSSSGRKSGANTAQDDTQGELDFLPPATQTTRMLKTTVEAAIYCDAPVASPVHRATAALLDMGIIAASCAVFFAIFRAFGGPVSWNKQTLPVFGGAFVLIGIFYGFCWMLANTETAGMRWTDLKVVGFNGFPPERGVRALRMTGCFLSLCSGMIGMFWALVDEEGLTWHDHMSKTFPTLRDSGSHIIRQ